MKKIEAKTLEAAYALATETFGCSLTELDCEIIQHASSGFLGLFAKPAIIVVAPRQTASAVEPAQKREKADRQKPTDNKNEAKAGRPKPIQKTIDRTPRETEPVTDKHSAAEETVLESFFDADAGEEKHLPDPVEDTDNASLQEEIEKELKTLITCTCFDIDVVEVDVVDNTAYIFIDGEDAALLIGKEGYRYNALSYLISNWLHNKHSLYIKLEIAQFLASQQEMIRSYMVPVIEHVEQEGWGRTRALDGILVQIALEQLREEFPNKYVAIKRTRSGERYVLINEFNKR